MSRLPSPGIDQKRLLTAARTDGYASKEPLTRSRTRHKEWEQEDEEATRDAKKEKCMYKRRKERNNGGLERRKEGKLEGKN